MRIKMNAGTMRDILNVPESTSNFEGVIRLKENRWILKCVDPSTSLMTALLVPEESMEDYDPSGPDEVTINFDQIKDMISSKKDSIEIEYDGGGIYLRSGGYEAHVGHVDPESVAGDSMAAPDLDHPVNATGDLTFIDEFVGKAQNVIGAGTVTLSPREEGFYLYASQDGNEMTKLVEWDDFEDYSFDLDKAGPTPEGMPPSDEMEGVSSTFADDFLDSLSYLTDNGSIKCGNDVPMKMTFRMENGIRASYILAPRIGEGESAGYMPEEVREKRRKKLA